MGRLLDEMKLTVKRRPGAWDDGPWVPGTESTFTITASRPQPVGPEVLEMLPEGTKSVARYTTLVPNGEPELIMIEDDAADNAADLITHNGTDYAITGLEDWDGHPLGYRYLLLLEA